MFKIVGAKALKAVVMRHKAFGTNGPTIDALRLGSWQVHVPLFKGNVHMYFRPSCRYDSQALDKSNSRLIRDGERRENPT